MVAYRFGRRAGADGRVGKVSPRKNEKRLAENVVCLHFGPFGCVDRGWSTALQLKNPRTPEKRETVKGDRPRFVA